ncbi:MAG: GNAT family N-acetyltransferase [Pseudomonadota bacterium]
MLNAGLAIDWYNESHREAVLCLFDDNTPTHFHPDERVILEQFLSEQARVYHVVLDGDHVVAAFGLSHDGQGRGRIVWFMAHPHWHGQGLGRMMIERLREQAVEKCVRTIDIAASHRSEAFYAHFGAKTESRTEHGWGKDMHRVDMVWEI